MNPGRVITQLGVTAAAATAFWTGLFFLVNPPDTDGMIFFAAWCSLLGVLIGGALLFVRTRNLKLGPYIFAAAVVALILGAVGTLAYEKQLERRVAEVEAFGGAVSRTVVTDRLSVQGVLAMREGGICAESELLDPATRRVTWSCARKLADRVSARDKDIFDEEARGASRDTLSLWYRVAGFGWIIFLTLLVDWAIQKTPLGSKSAGAETEPYPSAQTPVDTPPPPTLPAGSPEDPGDPDDPKAMPSAPPGEPVG